MSKMKILTWNINGIRAVTGKSGVSKLLKSLDADIICLQETKVTRDMLDEPIAIVDGFESYFSFSRKRTGYSGTANYCVRRCAPVRAEEGLTGRIQTDAETGVGYYGNIMVYSEKDLEALDAEGRCVITQHKLRLPDGAEKEVAVINVYVPRAGDRPERLVYKLKFLTLLRSRARALLRRNVHVIILGDLNLTHTALDNCDPKSDADFLRRSSRVWINNLLQESERDKNIARVHPDLAEVALGSEDDSEEEEEAERGGRSRRQSTDKPGVEYFSDVYRRLHPEERAGYTNWDTSTDARKSNYGRRLDYILVDTGLASHVTDCRILSEVEGSDHCPVVVTLDCEPVPSAVTPQLCSKHMPEFRGQQQKLSSFFTKSTVPKNTPCSSQDSSPPSSQEGNLPVTSMAERSPLKKSTSALVVSGSPGKKPGIKRSLTSKLGSSRGASVAPPQKKTKQQGPKQASLASFFAPKASNNSAMGGSATEFSNQERESQSKMGENSCKDNEAVICVVSESSETNNATSSHSDNPNPVVKDLNWDSQHKDCDTQKSGNTTTSKSENTLLAPSKTTNISSAVTWKSLLSGPAPPPLCPGHSEPCVLRTVRKNGPNKNKQFYCCSRPEGPPGNSQYRCNFFRWLQDQQRKKT